MTDSFLGILSTAQTCDDPKEDSLFQQFSCFSLFVASACVLFADDMKKFISTAFLCWRPLLFVFQKRLY